MKALPILFKSLADIVVRLGNIVSSRILVFGSTILSLHTKRVPSATSPIDVGENKHLTPGDHVTNRTATAADLDRGLIGIE